MLRPIFALVCVLLLGPALRAQEAKSPARNESRKVIELELTFAEWRSKPGADKAAAGTLKDIDIAALEKSGELIALQRMQCTTVEETPAYVQLGERRAEVTAVSQRGSTAQSSLRIQNYGTLMSVTPTIGMERILVDINVERSAPGPEQEGTVIGSEGENAIRTPRTSTMNLKTNIRLESGQTVVVGGSLFKEEGRAGGNIVTLKARIVD